jgi:hypothetical protein
MASACAVCGDELFVTDFNAPGSLVVFDLDGRLRRQVDGCEFGSVYAMAIHEGRIYVLSVGGDPDHSGHAELHVLELDGSTRQAISIPFGLAPSGSIFFHRDEVRVVSHGWLRCFRLLGA